MGHHIMPALPCAEYVDVCSLIRIMSSCVVYFSVLPRSNFIRIIIFNHDLCFQGRKQVSLFIYLSFKDVLLQHAVIILGRSDLSFLGLPPPLGL